ncbi:MAG: hypothetical protein EBR86_14435 [Planctomycetia bacterium]|nr:hypothetical protein [Planctomycetia bacterium]
MGEKAQFMRANGELDIRAELRIEAADGPKSPTFAIEAYSGAAIRQWWSATPMVVDLAVLEAEQALPILYGHNSWEPDAVLGQSTAVVNNGKALSLSGDLYGEGPIAEKVLARSRKGHKWQASIGADVISTRQIEQGQAVTVNGREFTGPLRVVRAKIREVSIVVLGADAATSAAIAAQASNGGMPMSAPITPGSEPEGAAKVAASNSPATAPEPTSEPKPVNAAGGDGASVGTATNEGILASQLAKAQAEAETARLALERERALQAERNARPSGAPAVHVAGTLPVGVTAALAWAAAICLNAGLQAPERHFKADVLNAAEPLQARASLQQLLLDAARANGYSTPEHKVHMGNMKDVLRAAFHRPIQASGAPSHHDIGNVLGTAYGKFVLAGYQGVVDSDPWRQLTQERPVADLKEVTGVRLIGDSRFKKLPTNGTIENFDAFDETRKIAAEMWARGTSLPLPYIINDDLGMLGQMGMILGDGAGQAQVEDFYTVLQAAIAASYYSQGTPAAGNALSSASLKTARTAFKRQTLAMRDGSTIPITVAPSFLLVPPELEDAAMELVNGTAVIIAGNTDKVQTNYNVNAGRYRVLSSAYLSNASTWGMGGTRPGFYPMETATLQGVTAPRRTRISRPWGSSSAVTSHGVTRPPRRRLCT